MRRLLSQMWRKRSQGCEHTGRGLDRYEGVLRVAGLPSLVEQVAALSGRGRPVKVLEIGCGEGRLLLELLARVQGPVELHGVNHPSWPVAAEGRALRETNERYRVLAPDELKRRGMPRLHLADAQDLSAFPVKDFDLVVSQVVLPHVLRKDRVLEQSARLLAPGGTFLHELDHRDGREPAWLGADLPRFVVRTGDVSEATSPRLRRSGIEVRFGRSDTYEVALAVFRAGDGPGGRALDLDLDLEERDTEVLRERKDLDPAHRWGVRSVFRAKT